MAGTFSQSEPTIVPPRAFKLRHNLGPQYVRIVVGIVHLLALGIRIVYSDLVGYQTSDIRLLWTITPNPPPPPPHPNTLSHPPPPPCQTSPPPPVSPPISDLSHCHHTLEV